MKDSNALHWSFDYNYGAQNPQFAQELIRTVRDYAPEADVHGSGPRTHVYDVLPNYWRGYSGGQRTETLRIGTATVQRHRDGPNLWHYVVNYENTTSGEHLKMRFCCLDEAHRPLTGNWDVDARNSAVDAYTRLKCTGYLTLDSGVRLSINGIDIPSGNVAAADKLTCNWALFDVIPRLSETIQDSCDAIGIALLEDLEHFRPKCRIGLLEAIQTPVPLTGYYLYGVGLLPSYWWLDANGDVVIASTFFETLVLREKRGGQV